MVDQSLLSVASSNRVAPPLMWEPESFATTVSTADAGDSYPLTLASAYGAGWALVTPPRRDKAPSCEVRPRVRLVPERDREPVRHRVLLATGCEATATTVRRILQGSDWEVEVASGPVELLAILRRAVDSGAFGGHVLIDDAWTGSAAGGALLEAVRCAAPRERVVRLAAGPDVEAKDGGERVIQQPVQRAELEALLGIGTDRNRSTAWALASPVLDRAVWIDEVWGVSRVDGDHDLWITLLAQFAARYEGLSWRLGAELRAEGAADVTVRVCRIAGAAAALGLRRLSSALRDLSESARMDVSAARRRRIDDFLKVHSKTFASVEMLLAEEGIESLGVPLGLVDPLRAA